MANDRRVQAVEDTNAALQRVLNDGIKPYASEIARTWLDGEVAVVFHMVAPAAEKVARSLGWAGGPSGCARMNRSRAESLARKLPKSDPAARWLGGRRPGRIFIVSGSGTLCVNYEPQKGYSLLEGSTDTAWMS